MWGQGESKPAGGASGAAADEEEEEARAGSQSLSAPPPPSSASTAGGLDDLLGLSAPAAAPAPAAVDALSVPVTRRIMIDASQKDAVAAWLAAASARPKAKLFEDAHVQIGVARALGGADASVTLYVGNKTAVPFVGLKVRVPEFAGVRATVAEPPASVGARAQGTVTIALEALAPFAGAPALQVSFVSEPGTGHAYALSVPVSVAAFCERAPLPAADFKTRWGALAGAPREVTAVVPCGAGAAAPSKDAAVAALRDALNMEPVEAGAPGATGASFFRSKALGPNGAPISVGCLAMVIPDAAAGAYKVAVRTQHPDVSKSLMTTLQAVLGA